jgi:hypothetical protein
MPTPDRIVIRRRLALGAVILIFAIIAAVLIANAMSARPAGEPLPAVVEGVRPPGPDIAPSPLPLPLVPVTRAELIAAAGRASDAYAAGRPAPEQNAELVGRRFLLRIPFGCGGPSGPDAATAEPYWTHDASGGTVRISAPSQVWTEAAWVRELAGSLAFDAVEGFWLPRPWTGSEDCPPDASAQAGPASPQTLGLAMFFAPNSSRLMRRAGRAYEHVAKAPRGAGPVAPKGYRLKLSGQVASFADGRPVGCHAERAEQRPVCLVAVTFEEIAFEDPATGQTLAEWR